METATVQVNGKEAHTVEGIFVEFKGGNVYDTHPYLQRNYARQYVRGQAPIPDRPYRLEKVIQMEKQEDMALISSIATEKKFLVALDSVEVTANV